MEEIRIAENTTRYEHARSCLRSGMEFAVRLHRVQGRKQARRTFFPQVSSPDDRRTAAVDSDPHILRPGPQRLEAQTVDDQIDVCRSKN